MQRLLLVANGGSGVDKVLEVLTKTLGGSIIVGEFGIVTTPWESTKKYNDKIKNETRKYADRLYRSIAENRQGSISLGNLIWFNIFKKMSSISKETLPTDYEYYRDKKDYFYDVKVSTLKSAVAKMIASFRVWTMKRQVIFH